VQFCCVKGQPLAINIENAAEKYLLGKIGSIGNFLAMHFLDIYVQ
jgi:hypothetical protein